MKIGGKNMALKSISCSPECGFMVRSHLEEEVLKLAEQHTKEVHPMMTVSREDLKAKLKNL